MEKTNLLSLIVLSGAIGFAAAPVWSQTPSKTKPGEEQNLAPGGEQKGNTGAPMSAQGASQSGSSKTSKAGEDQNLAPGGQQKGNTGAPMSAQGGSQSSTGSGGVTSMGRSDVKKIQEALRDKGNDPGPIDGIMGSRTRAAIKSFQSANNLKSTGMVDAETANKLGVEQPQGSSMRR